MINQKWQCPKCKDVSSYTSDRVYAEIYCTKCGTSRMMIERLS